MEELTLTLAGYTGYVLEAWLHPEDCDGRKRERFLERVRANDHLLVRDVSAFGLLTIFVDTRDEDYPVKQAMEYVQLCWMNKAKNSTHWAEILNKYNTIRGSKIGLPPQAGNDYPGHIDDDLDMLDTGGIP